MGLTLTRVPSFSAGLPHALAAWRARGGSLVVPRRELATDALLAEASPVGAVLGREAITFAALRSRVAEAAGIPEPERPSRVETRLALREVLHGCERDLAAFEESAEAPGFLSGIERALTELRGARVAPERVTAAATTQIARAVAAVHAAAQEAVRFPADPVWETVDAAARVTAFPPVTVAGFDDVTPADWALLRALGRVTDVEAVPPFDPARAAHEARRDRQARWAADAAVRTAGAAPATGPAALAERLFQDGHPLAGDVALRLAGATGTRGMLRVALEEALAAADAGTPLDRIALVVPRLAEARDDLERLLVDWGVPYRLASRERVLEAPLALALTHLLHLGELDPDGAGALDHLLGWLRTPYSGADPEEVDRFEIAARRGNLAGRGQLMARWQGGAIAPARRLVAAATQGPRAQLAALLEHGWAALRRVCAPHEVPTAADLRDRAALAALAGLAGSLPGGDEPDGPEEPERARARGPLPPGALGEIVADLTVVTRTETPGGLDVHDLASLRGGAYDVVVICGLDGDGTPGRPAPDPFLADLRAGLGDVLPARAPGTSEARLRFTHAIDAARERAVLVRRLVDDDGREVAPSPYWVETARVAGRDPEALDRSTGAHGEIADRPDAARAEREALRTLALDGKVAPGLLAEAAARRVRPTGLPGDAFHDRPRFRVTEIEGYLRCPYGWFHQHVLSPQPIAEAVDPAFEGTLGHVALEGVYRRMRDQAAGPCTPATVGRYRETLAAVLPQVAAERRPPGAGAPYEALVARLGRHLGDLLEREAALGSRMVPSILEHRMEDGVILAPVAPGVALSGQVDRIDLAGPLALVVDYKRSGADFSARSDDVSKRLQLPLYAEMARNTLDRPVEPIGGLYVGLLKPRVTGAVRDDVAEAPAVGRTLTVTVDRWREITGEAVSAARDAVGRIRRGALDPPTIGGCSHWCRCGDLWR